jgi:hypothetical protein
VKPGSTSSVVRNRMSWIKGVKGVKGVKEVKEVKGVKEVNGFPVPS